MAFFNKIIAFLMFFISLLSGMNLLPSNPVTPEENNTIMFVSDFQGADRETEFNAILGKMDEEPGLLVCGGDYQTTVGAVGASDFGINTIKDIVNTKWADNKIQYFFVQGNHDPASTEQLNKTGLYEFEDYVLYLINEDDYPHSQNASSKKKNTVKKTADALNSALEDLAKTGETRPVFIVTHVPLHYSSRNSAKDNVNAKYIFDVVNENAKYLDIVFLFGHNHSGNYDDYIGGSVNYIGIGDTMNVGGTNEETAINFTYMNCGYIGYSDNSLSGSSTNALSATTITVYDTYLEMQKHTKNGEFYNSGVIIERNAVKAAKAA